MTTNQLSELECKFIDDLREVEGQDFPMVREWSLWSEYFIKEGLIKDQMYESRHVAGVEIPGYNVIWGVDKYYPLTDKGKELFRVLTEEKGVKLAQHKNSI